LEGQKTATKIMVRRDIFRPIFETEQCGSHSNNMLGGIHAFVKAQVGI
jgi:hypothetical protein